MSTAGKFIPGGTARKTRPVGAPAPIRGPERPGTEPKKSSNRLLAKGADLTQKQVPKKQRLPILLMSSVVCCLLVSIAWYEFGVKPVRLALALEKQKEAAQQKQMAAAATVEATKPKADAKVPVILTTVIVNSSPAGTATIADAQLPTPATFDKVPAGKANLVLHADGYDDYKQEISGVAGKPTDLGTVQLVRSTGTMILSSAQGVISYALTGPDGYQHQGQTPDKLENLPAGDYQLTARQEDWQLAPMALALHSHDTLRKDVKFPFGSLALTSTPPGAIVRRNNKVLGQTPLNLEQVRPGEMNLSVDLPPYMLQRVAVTVPEGGGVSKEIALPTGKDFVTASGMPMVWIPDGGFWAGKFEVTQKVFEAVTGYNPSSFRKPMRPVETVTWEQAKAFCAKLNQSEEAAGKLPKGYHYTLPTESQWDTFSADASIDLAAMSRTTTLTSTQDVGASEPNKYGLYDTIGNVWEWCADSLDESGAHSLRGGSWLSSTENFPSADTRSAGAAKYADRFTGFRVVLVGP